MLTEILTCETTLKASTKSTTICGRATIFSTIQHHDFDVPFQNLRRRNINNLSSIRLEMRPKGDNAEHLDNFLINKPQCDSGRFLHDPGHRQIYDRLHDKFRNSLLGSDLCAFKMSFTICGTITSTICRGSTRSSSLHAKSSRSATLTGDSQRASFPRQ